MDDTPLPLTAHLAELRSRIFKILGAWVVGTALAWSHSRDIFEFLLAPATRALANHGGKLQAIAPTEIFFTYLKCALLAGLIFALPVIFWQIWAFVAPGLYPKERRVAVPFVAASTVLFLTGGVFGYLAVFPVIYKFFASLGSSFVESAWTMREVFNLSARLLLAFGLGFELPVAIFFLSMAGIVDPRRLMRGLKYAVLVAFVVGAILTPPDVVSQCLLAGPLILLYLLGVGVAYVFAPRREQDAAKGDEEGERAAT
jgi:sec-independent protein translocase protein TatC